MLMLPIIAQEGKTENTSEDSGWSSGWVASIAFAIFKIFSFSLLSRWLNYRWASEDCNLPGKQERLGRICQMARGLQQVPFSISMRVLFPFSISIRVLFPLSISTSLVRCWVQGQRAAGQSLAPSRQLLRSWTPCRKPTSGNSWKLTSGDSLKLTPGDSCKLTL